MTAIIPKTKPRRLLKRSSTCLLMLGVGLSTTAIAVAQFVPDSGLQDILGNSTGIPTTPTFPTDSTGIPTTPPTFPTDSPQNQSNPFEDYWRQAEELYRHVSNKNISGILGQIEKILGQMGIMSPKDYPGEIGEILGQPRHGGSEPGTTPKGNPTTPAQIYEQQQILTDKANSDELWVYTDSVLGKGEWGGQTRLKQSREINAASAQAANSSYTISASRSQQAAQNAELAQIAANSMDKLSVQAQSRTATQDVVKDQAAQFSEMGKSNAAMSRQLSTLSEQQAIAANQLSALSTQSRVGNEHLTELRIGQSIGNIQLHDIFNAQRHDNHMDVIERQKTAQFAIGATDGIYIPGFLAQPSH